MPQLCWHRRVWLYIDWGAQHFQTAWLPAQLSLSLCLSPSLAHPGSFIGPQPTEGRWKPPHPIQATGRESQHDSGHQSVHPKGPLNTQSLQISTHHAPHTIYTIIYTQRREGEFQRIRKSGFKRGVQNGEHGERILCHPSKVLTFLTYHTPNSTHAIYYTPYTTNYIHYTANNTHRLQMPDTTHYTYLHTTCSSYTTNSFYIKRQH